MPWTRNPSIETEDQPVQYYAEVGDYVLHAWALADHSGSWLITTVLGDTETERVGIAPSLEQAQRDAAGRLRQVYLTGLEELQSLESARGVQYLPGR